MRCLSCGAPIPAQADACPVCRSPIFLTPARQLVGLGYTLNRIDELVADGTLDPASAGRTRSRLAAELDRIRGQVPAPPTVAGPLPGSRAAGRRAPRPARFGTRQRAQPAADRPAGADRVLMTQTPSLLLYIGAFLIVVSALILVNVSGRQISDAAKLALMLGGTAAFLVAGLVCHRSPRVVPAGRTFLAVGALLIPIDVVATYALFLRASPLTRPELWLGGSLVASLLYATLARRGFGDVYARGCFVATLSATLALSEALKLSEARSVNAVLVLAIAHLVFARRVPATSPWRQLADPLPRPAELLAILALAGGAFVAAIGGAGTADRIDAVLTVALGTAFFGIERELRSERLAALAGIGVTVLAAVRVSDPQPWVYAVALLGLAFAYGPGAERLLPLPAARTDETRSIGYGWLLLAFLVAADRVPPAAGALVFGGGIVHLVITELRHARPRGRLVSDVLPFALDHPRVFLAAAALHPFMRDALLAFGWPDLQRLVADGSAPALATAFFSASLALLAVAAVALLRGWPQRDAAAASAVTSAGLVLLLAASDPTRLAPFAISYALLAAAAALTAGEPRLLWAAGAFSAVGMLALYDALYVPATERAPRLLVIGVAAYLVALAARGPYARAVREAALGGVLFAAFVALDVAQRESVREVVDARDWAIAAAAFLLLGLAGSVEARLRRSFDIAIGSAAAALVGIEMFVARTHARDPQAYDIPLAVFLIGGALVALRYGSPAWRELVPAAEAAGAAVLLGPTYLETWSHDAFANGARILGESMVLLAIGTLLRRRILVAAAVVFVSLDALRALADVADRLPNWLTFALSGAILLAVGFVLLVRQDVWERAQRATQAWWERWAPATEEP